MIFINIRGADFKNQHHFQILRSNFEISGIPDFLLFIVVCATNDLHVTFQWPWGHIDFQLIFAQLSEEHFSISYLLVRHDLMVKQWSNVYNKVLFLGIFSYFFDFMTSIWPFWKVQLKILLFCCFTFCVSTSNVVSNYRCVDSFFWKSGIPIFLSFFADFEKYLSVTFKWPLCVIFSK